MKLRVMKTFRIDAEALKTYPAKAAAAREATAPGQIKPAAQPAWLAAGAVYIAGDVIEVNPYEAAELGVVAPVDALEVQS